MGTCNGIGTGLRGWRHPADGASTATLWFLVVYLPVVPLRRCRLRTLTDFENEPFVPTTAPDTGRTTWLRGGFSWSDPVAIEERLPLAWREVLATYAWAYVLVPALCLWPFWNLDAAVWILRRLGDDPAAQPPAPWVGTLVVIAVANGLGVLLTAARRMRGYPGSRPPAAVGV